MQNNQKQSNIKISDDAFMELYEKRVIILMENDRAEGGGFSQILLTQEQFQEVMKTLIGCFPKVRDVDNPQIDWIDMQIKKDFLIPGKMFEGVKNTA